MKAVRWWNLKPKSVTSGAAKGLHVWLPGTPLGQILLIVFFLWDVCGGWVGGWVGESRRKSYTSIMVSLFCATKSEATFTPLSTTFT